MLTEEQLNAVKASIIESLYENDTYMSLVEETIFASLKEEGIDTDSLLEDYFSDLVASLVPGLSY